MSRPRMLLMLGIVATLVGIPACSRPQPAGGAKTKVAFVSNNAEQFWTIAEAGTRKAADDFAVDVVFRRPATGTAAEQKQIIETALAQGVKGIAISVNDPKNQVDFLNEVASQVPLVTQDNDAPDSKRSCYIGTNNYTAGQAAGKLVKEVMPQGGTVAIFVGKPDPLNARERRQGVLDELAGVKDAQGPKEYGKYKLLGTFYDDVNLAIAKEKAATALVQVQNEPNVCFVGLWAYNPPAILSAVQEAGKAGKVNIVAFDEYPETLQGIKDGHIFASIVQQPYEFGYQSIKMLSSLAKGDKTSVPKDGILYVPHKVIKKDNVEEFHAQLNKLLGK